MISFLDSFARAFPNEKTAVIAQKIRAVQAKLRAAQKMFDNACDDPAYAEEFWLAWDEFKKVGEP